MRLIEWLNEPRRVVVLRWQVFLARAFALMAAINFALTILNFVLQILNWGLDRVVSS